MNPTEVNKGPPKTPFLHAEWTNSRSPSKMLYGQFNAQFLLNLVNSRLDLSSDRTQLQTTPIATKEKKNQWKLPETPFLHAKSTNVNNSLMGNFNLWLSFNVATAVRLHWSSAAMVAMDFRQAIHLGTFRRKRSERKMKRGMPFPIRNVSPGKRKERKK